MCNAQFEKGSEMTDAIFNERSIQVVEKMTKEIMAAIGKAADQNIPNVMLSGALHNIAVWADQVFVVVPTNSILDGGGEDE